MLAAFQVSLAVSALLTFEPVVTKARGAERGLQVHLLIRRFVESHLTLQAHTSTTALVTRLDRVVLVTHGMQAHWLRKACCITRVYIATDATSMLTH